MVNDDKYIVFVVSGGHGKCIMSTAVIEAMSKKYDDRKIIVVSGWDAPYYGNPYIDKFYMFDRLDNYFYDLYIKDKDTIIFQHDPYNESDYILKKKHVIEIWCNLFNIPYNGEQPKLYLNDREKEIVKHKIKPETGKPIMLIQTNGGLHHTQYSKISWARDLPLMIAQNVVDYYCKSYRILHLRIDGQPELKNVEPLNLPLREIYGVFELSKKRLFIDSFSQHVAAALGMSSTVCWIVNKPDILGYDVHDNIFPNVEAKREMNKHSFLEQYDITGQIQQFPFDTVNIFNPIEIIESIKKH